MNLKKYLKPKVILHYAVIGAAAIVAMHHSNPIVLNIVMTNIVLVTIVVAATDMVLENVLKI